MTTTFRDGKKFTDGRTFNPLESRPFDSSSSDRKYNAIIWEDGDTSCNCKGWATHKRCTHTRQMIELALSFHWGAAVHDLVLAKRGEQNAASVQERRTEAERTAEMIRQEVAETERIARARRATHPDWQSKPKPTSKRDDDKPPEPGQRRIKL